MEKILLNQMSMIANMLSSGQRKYYDAMLKNAKNVECVSLSEVFTEREIRLIAKAINPREKECYRNAHLLTQLFPDRVRYVEGQTAVCGISIDHAFNKVDDKYVDLTLEFCLKENIKEKEYLSIGEYDIKTITEVALETQYYGDIFRNIFIKNLKK